MALSAFSVLDHDQLTRRTMGSESLRVEMLSLFVTEVERLLRQVQQADDAQTRSSRLNAIRELARSIGARRLDEAARLANLDAVVSDHSMATVQRAVAEVVAAVRAGAP